MNTPAKPSKLTVERIYDTPNLSGGVIGDILWRPGHAMLTYLFGTDADAQVRGYDIATGEHLVVFDCARIAAPKGRLSVRPMHAESPMESGRSKRMLAATELSYQWLPSGEALLIRVGISTPQIFDIENNSLRPLTLNPEPVRDPRISPDGRFISFVRGWDLYMVDLTSGQETALTTGSSEEMRTATPDTMGDLLYDSGHWWSPDASQIAYLQTDERQVPLFWYANLMSSDGQNEPQRFPQPGDPIPVMALKVVSSSGYGWIDTSAWQGWYLARVCWLPDSRHLALQMLNRAQNVLELVIADSLTGTCHTVLRETDPAWVNVTNDLRFFSDSQHFIWSSERASYRHLYLYHIDGTELGALTSGPEACVAVEGLDEANGAIYYLTWPDPYTDAKVQRCRFELDEQGLRVLGNEVLTKGEGSHFSHPSPDFKYFADHCSSAIQPPQLKLCDSSGEHIAMVEDNACPELTKYVLQNFEFGSLAAATLGIPSDSMPLHTKLLKPIGIEEGKKYPVIVYVYGGPLPGGFGLARNVLNYWRPVPELWMQMMTQQGFGVFSLDNRGSNAIPRGHDWETPIHKQLGRVELADQLRGIEYLRGLPWVDEERIGLLGGSFGGFMTLSGVLREEAVGTFRSAVAFAPVTNWRHYDCVYTERYMELPGENLAGYEKSTLLDYAKNLDDAVLLLHGAADPNVHLQHTIELTERLIQCSKRFRMMLYPNEVHMSFFGQGQGPMRLWQQITDYFMDTLGNGTSEYERYGGWRK